VESVWRGKVIIFLILALTATVVLSPLAITSVPNDMDLVNHLAAIVQAKMAAIEGQFPPRVMPMLSAFRYPYYQFYSPSSYLLPEKIYQYITTQNPYAAYKITLWIALLFGGIYLYRLVRWMTGSKQIALLSSVAYLSSPYYILVLNHLGAFSEGIALGLLPAVLYYTLRFYFSPNLHRFICLAAGWYFLATTHLITFFYGSLFVAMLLVLTTFYSRTNWRNLIYTGLAYVYGCMLALWFLAPIKIFQKSFSVRSSFIFQESTFKIYLSNLFSPFRNIEQQLNAGDLGSTIGAIHPSLGLPFLAGIATCIFLLSRNYKFTQKNASRLFLPLLTLFFIALMLIWSPWDLWQKLPSDFRVGQYSWRLLGQCNWLCALLLPFSLLWLFNNKISSREMLLGIFLILFSTSTWLDTSEMSFMQDNFVELIKNPGLVFNKTALTINAQENSRYVDSVDTIPVYAPFIGHKLLFKRSYKFSRVNLARMDHPVFMMDGTYSHIDPYILHMSLDGKVVGSHLLNKSSDFSWRIPFTLAAEKKSLKTVEMEFTAEPVAGASTVTPAVNVTQMFLSEVGDTTTTLSVDTTLSYCKQYSVTTVCSIPPQRIGKLVELPIFYYPGLLSLSLNGKKIMPFSILYKDLLIAGVKVQPHQVNIIKVEFSGLSWANRVSAASWFGWILLVIVMVVRKINSRNFKRTY
jgi:hypothetical protein